MRGIMGIGAGFKSATKRLLLAAGAAATGGGSVFSPISKYNTTTKKVDKVLEKSKIDKAKLKILRKHAVKQKQIEIAESNNYKH